MESLSQTYPWLQEAVKKGVILGIIHIIVFTLLYFILPSKTTGFSYLFFILFLNLGYTIYHGIQMRKEIGGFIDFGMAFKFVFILLAVNGFLALVFNIILSLIEPSFADTMAQATQDVSVYWAQKFGAPESQIDQMREKFDYEGTKARYSLTGLLSGFGFGILFYALGATIAALVIRKRQPEVL